MRVWARHIWRALLGSYWFLPSVMIVLAGALAFVMLQLDIAWDPADDAAWPVYAGGAEGARALLSTIASSVITVAGVVFSITVAALTQASSQFGPRLLRNFMNDRGNQLVLGTFTATFVYCILVVRSVRGNDGSEFVPHAAVSVGVALALSSIGVLIYFIHHISQSLQAPVVAAKAAAELCEAIDRAFVAEPAGQGECPETAPIDAGEAHVRVLAGRSGYVQAIDEAALLEVAGEHGVRIEMLVRPGHFVVHDAAVALVAPVAPPEVAGKIAGALLVGRQATAEQDLEFFVRQLVEIACRALSPGINDPFTAMECVDWLGAAACEAARRPAPSAWRCTPDGEARVLLRRWDFAGILQAAFDPIRQNAGGHVSVVIRLLERLRDVAEAAPPSLLPAVREQIEALRHARGAMTFCEADLADIDRRFTRALEAASGTEGKRAAS